MLVADRGHMCLSSLFFFFNFSVFHFLVTEEKVK